MCSGKSTLCHILGAYAVKMGRSPMMVDLDIGQGVLGFNEMVDHEIVYCFIFGLIEKKGYQGVFLVFLCIQPPSPSL